MTEGSGQCREQRCTRHGVVVRSDPVGLVPPSESGNVSDEAVEIVESGADRIQLLGELPALVSEFGGEELAELWRSCEEPCVEVGDECRKVGVGPRNRGLDDGDLLWCHAGSEPRCASAAESSDYSSRPMVTVKRAVKDSPGFMSGAVPSTRLFVGAVIGSRATNGRPGGTQT